MGLLSFLFGGGESHAQTKTFEVDGQKIETTKSPYSLEWEGMGDLAPGDRERLSAILIRASVFIDGYKGNVSNGNAFSSRTLDTVLKSWRADGPPTKATQEEVIELVGCAFGQGMVDELGFEWQLVTDQYGTDYAVVDKVYTFSGFPFSTDMKTIEDDRANDALENVMLVLKAHKQDAAADPTKFQRR